jgi:hypothetical protein
MLEHPWWGHRPEEHRPRQPRTRPKLHHHRLILEHAQQVQEHQTAWLPRHWNAVQMSTLLALPMSNTLCSFIPLGGSPDATRGSRNLSLGPTR